MRREVELLNIQHPTSNFEHPMLRNQEAAALVGRPRCHAHPQPTERMVTLVVATRNAHKVGEIRDILGQGFRCLSLQDFEGPPEVVEDASTFAGNATKKAVALANWLAGARSEIARAADGKVLVLADDSGLEVDALGGAPGIHSARFAALDAGKPGNSPTAENNAKLLRLLANVPLERRTARFRCVLALTPLPHSQPDSASPVCLADEAELETELFEGTCEGRIGFEERGRGGFGYDPLFIPQGYQNTLGELSEQVKNGISHRAKALASLKAKFRS
jgi:XTP/dITP diphosphohydrolase